MISLRSVRLIARRELVTHLLTKSFILGVLLTPMLLLLVMMLPAGSREPLPVPIAIVDASGKASSAFLSALRSHWERGGRYLAPGPDLVLGTPDNLAEALAIADQQAADGACDVVVVFEEGFPADHQITLRTPLGVTLPPMLRDTLLAVGRETVLRLNTLAIPGLPSSTRDELLRGVTLKEEESSLPPKNATGAAAMLQGLGFVILLYLTTVAMSHALLTSVIEEKSSKVAELLLSSVSPGELMAGKILGIGGVGLCLVGVWMATGLLATSGSSSRVHVDARLVVVFSIYFVTGFLLYAAILAGVGALVSSLKEAQHLVTPVTLVLMIPVLCWWQIAQDPSGWLAVTLSWIPLTAPIAMMNRAASVEPPGALEITFSILWMCLAIGIALHFAARLFRVGILLVGSPPGIATIFGWMFRGR